MALEIITKEDLEIFKTELLSAIEKMLKSPATQQKKYLQSPEVMKLLGISSGTLQHLRVTDKLPFTKIGGKIFYEMTDIEKMMDENRRK